MSELDPLLGGSAFDIETMLASDDLAAVLEALVFLGGKHRVDRDDLPEDFLPFVQRRADVAHLATSEVAWAREAALLALIDIKQRLPEH